MRMCRALTPTSVRPLASDVLVVGAVLAGAGSVVVGAAGFVVGGAVGAAGAAVGGAVGAAVDGDAAVDVVDGARSTAVRSPAAWSVGSRRRWVAVETGW